MFLALFGWFERQAKRNPVKSILGTSPDFETHPHPRTFGAPTPFGGTSGLTEAAHDRRPALCRESAA